MKNDYYISGILYVNCMDFSRLLDILTYGKRQNEMFDLFLFLSFAAIKSLFIMPFIICGKLRMNSKVNHFSSVFSFQDQYLQNNAKLHD